MAQQDSGYSRYYPFEEILLAGYGYPGGCDTSIDIILKFLRQISMLDFNFIFCQAYYSLYDFISPKLNLSNIFCKICFVLTAIRIKSFLRSMQQKKLNGDGKDMLSGQIAIAGRFEQRYETQGADQNQTDQQRNGRKKMKKQAMHHNSEEQGPLEEIF